MNDMYHGDEMYCNGSCGRCDDCEYNNDMQAEQDYQEWSDEQCG